MWTALPNGSKIAATSSSIARPVVPDVGHRQRDVLGERAVAPDPEADRVGAQVAPAGQAVAAAAAHDVTLARHEVARVEVGHVAADLDDLADELVADDERRLDRPGGPRIPRLDVEVGAADARLVDADQDVVDADGRHRDVAQLEARAGGGLDQGEHRVPAMPSTSSARRSSASSTSVQSMTGFSTEPMPSISQRTRSPGCEEDRRVAEDADARRACPVAMMSPGSRVIERLMYSISSATLQIMSAVVLSCIRISRAGVRAGAGDPPRPKPERLGVVDLVGGDEDRAHRQERVGALGAQPLAVADLALAERRRARPASRGR